MRRGRLSRLRPFGRRGFSVIEILVALLIISVLVAVVYPVVLQQIRKWEALRVARDLSHLRLAIEQFHLDTGNQPLYLTHMANQITVSDSAAAWHLVSPEYSQREVRGWNGPYIDSPLAASLRIDDAVTTGFGARIVNDVYCYDLGINNEVPCDTGTWVAVRVEGLVGHQFDLINDLIDPGEPAIPGPTGGRQTGRLVFLGGGGIDWGLTYGSLYYLAVPYMTR